MRPWEILREELIRIREEDPRALRSGPSLDHLDSQPAPVQVHLKAWAAPRAHRLHDALGDYVELVVGVQRFPQRVPLHGIISQREMPDADPTRVTVATDGDLVATSGRVLQTEVRVANHSDAVLTMSDPTLYGVVLDPHTGTVVNGDIRWVPAIAAPPANINPGSSRSLQARVPTASCSPTLGYSVPPGDWEVRFRLPLRGGDRYSSPLRLQVIAATAPA